MSDLTPAGPVAPGSKPFLSNRVYDVLKFIAQIVLPALGTLYFVLAELWGLPNPEEVVGTIVAVDAFLGVLLGVSTRAYVNSDAPYDGVMNIGEGRDSLVLNDDVEALETKNQLVFKVNPPA